MISFTVYGVARPAGSKRPVMAGGRLRAIDSSGENGRAWRQDIAGAAIQAMNGQAPLEGPLRLTLVFITNRPKAHFNARGIIKLNAPHRPATRPDLLKLARAVEDALTGIVYRDDSQIVEEALFKHFSNGTPPRVEITIQQI